MIRDEILSTPCPRCGAAAGVDCDGAIYRAFGETVFHAERAGLVPPTAAEFDRPVIAKRVYWDESGAHFVADSWERDGLALGARVHSTGLYPQTVRCGNRDYTLYVVLAYGFLPSETQA